MDTERRRGHFLLIPALAMGVGWGLRGYIGGGPLGAMIPGALTAMSLALLLKLGPGESAVAAGFGAIGIGFGGEMTYGETVGLISRPESFVWGCFGLSLKGAVWGLLGGAVLGSGLVAGNLRRRDLCASSALLVLGTAAGWRVVNVPKLISFSPTRHELWAGLLLGGLFWLLYMALSGAGAAPLRFGLLGAAGGGAGFGLGGSFLAWARMSNLQGPVDSWKVMEFTFGLCFGLGLGLAAWRLRRGLRAVPVEVTRAAPEGIPAAAEISATIAMVLAVMGAESHLPLRFSYLVAGAALLCLLPSRPWLAGQTAVSLTVAAFSVDLVESVLERLHGRNEISLWVTAAAVSGASAWVVARVRAAESEPTATFLYGLLWTAVACSVVKSLAGYPVAPAHAFVELTFLLGALALTATLRRLDWGQSPN